jgi:hypothetical protein
MYNLIIILPIFCFMIIFEIIFVKYHLIYYALNEQKIFYLILPYKKYTGCLKIINDGCVIVIYVTRLVINLYLWDE